MGVRNHNAPFTVEESHFVPNLETRPTAFCKEPVDVLHGCWNPLDGRLLNYQPHLWSLHQDADEFDVVPKQFVVKLPPFEIGDRRGALVFVLPVKH